MYKKPLLFIPENGMHNYAHGFLFSKVSFLSHAPCMEINSTDSTESVLIAHLPVANIKKALLCNFNSCSAEYMLHSNDTAETNLLLPGFSRLQPNYISCLFKNAIFPARILENLFCNFLKTI